MIGLNVDVNSRLVAVWFITPGILRRGRLRWCIPVQRYCSLEWLILRGSRSVGGDGPEALSKETPSQLGPTGRPSHCAADCPWDWDDHGSSLAPCAVISLQRLVLARRLRDTLHRLGLPGQHHRLLAERGVISGLLEELLGFVVAAAVWPVPNCGVGA